MKSLKKMQGMVSTALLANPMVILVIVIIIGTIIGGFYTWAYNKGFTSAEKEYAEKMEKMIAKNNKALEDIEAQSSKSAVLADEKFDSVMGTLDQILVKINKEKAVRDAQVYNEKGELLICTNVKGPIRLGTDFSAEWNALNNAQKGAKK